MTSTGKTTRKLEWAFSLFDVDKNGYITKTEVTEICQVRGEEVWGWVVVCGVVCKGDVIVMINAYRCMVFFCDGDVDDSGIGDDGCPSASSRF